MDVLPEDVVLFEYPLFDVVDFVDELLPLDFVVDLTDEPRDFVVRYRDEGELIVFLVAPESVRERYVLLFFARL